MNSHCICAKPAACGNLHTRLVGVVSLIDWLLRGIPLLRQATMCGMRCVYAVTFRG